VEASRRSFFFLRSRLKDHLSPVDVGLNRTDRAFNDELYPNGSREMNDNVSVIHELREKVLIFNPIEVVLQILNSFQVADVLHAARREVVQEHNLLSSLQQSLREVRTDKSRTTRD